GDNGCGGNCGTCPTGAVCSLGQCVTLPPHPRDFVSLPIARTGITFPDTPLNPDGTTPGAIPATFDVNSSGEATYRVPLEVAPGRGGLQPTLALAYSSGTGNGFLGVGWSLEGLSAISRCNKNLGQDGVTSAPKFSATINTNDDLDALCLDGQELV